MIKDDLHSCGTVDWAAVYPREILRRALDLNAMFLIIVHNHPSGDGKFSTADIDITLEIQKILETIDIKLFDHLLVAKGIVYSAKNMFLIK